MEIESEIREYLAREVLGGVDPREVEPEEALVATGRIDSLGLLRLLGFIQQRYGVDLMASGGPEDFQSIVTLTAAVSRHGQR